MADYPMRLSHQVPGWVRRGAFYHLRFRALPASTPQLTDPTLAPSLLDSARWYHASARWYCQLLLLMPDHVHALVAFPPEQKMSAIVGSWKGFQTKRHGIKWQENYFDHRIRHRTELDEKAAYIRRNPVAKNLCRVESDWPWVITCI